MISEVLFNVAPYVRQLGNVKDYLLPSQAMKEALGLALKSNNEQWADRDYSITIGEPAYIKIPTKKVVKDNDFALKTASEPLNMGDFIVV